MLPRTCVLILAGGDATRLGGVDKPLLRLGACSIIEHLIGRLLGQANDIAISANGDPHRYAPLGYPVLADQVSGRGPLAGVLRGLHWAAERGADQMLSVPGDTPFIPADLLARLGQAPAWAENGAGLHPLIALWPTDCRTALAEWLADQPSGRVRAFGTLIAMRPVRFDDTPDPFHNINTPDDLAQAALRQR